jgi:hypothetical protein
MVQFYYTSVVSQDFLQVYDPRIFSLHSSLAKDEISIISSDIDSAAIEACIVDYVFNVITLGGINID